ncbi:MAG: regulatory protein RecX [candidate division WOR-3 bacterium]|uniref:Regulatory protein RecX n=1 Tax=candidate division WOR-3 bacterium TaxID=2052148 RepID=A0A7V4CHC9_UNCW3
MKKEKTEYTVTQLKESKNGRYYTLFLDKKNVGTFLKSTIRKFALEVGDKITEEELTKIIETDQVKRLQDYSLRLLSRRDYSENEFKEKLLKRGYPANVVEQVINNLKELDYLSDKNFIKNYVAHSLSFRKRGKVAIKQELLRKGVEEKAIDEYLLEVSEEVPARELVEKYLPKIKKQLEKKKEKNKITGNPKNYLKSRLKELLLRRGFTNRTIEKVLEEVTG